MDSRTPMQPDEVLCRLPAVAQQTGLQKSTLYSLIARGEFPRPIRISARCVAWRKSEVQRWIDQRVQEASGHAANA